MRKGGARKETDPTNPLTAYARSKIGSEKAMAELDRKGMLVTSLRFATACGMSDRLRLDLVLNDFVACAITSGEITVLSDGTPWRPLIDVEDMARAILWAIRRKPDKGGEFLAVNAGRDEGNYQVRELAEAVARQAPGAKVSINTNAPPDKRSYRVDFSLFRSLAPDFIPQLSLDQSITRLREGLGAMDFADEDFRSSPFMRLKTLDATWPRAVSVRICAGASVRTTWEPTPTSFHRTPLERAWRIELKKPVTTVRASSPGCLAVGLGRARQANKPLTLDEGGPWGLHYQLPPAAEVKVVRAIKGALWDGIVDLRAGSTTYPLPKVFRRGLRHPCGPIPRAAR